jgi:hypothetical protein
MTTTVNPREARLQRSLKRLGYELVDADEGNFYIRCDGRRVHDAESDLLGFSIDGVEAWIKQQAKRNGPGVRLRGAKAKR